MPPPDIPFVATAPAVTITTTNTTTITSAFTAIHSLHPYGT